MNFRTENDVVLLDEKKSPPELITEAIGRVYAERMTTTSGGNFSIRDEEDPYAIWITPAGVDKGSLTEKEIVRVLSDGSTEGLFRASSEFPIHQTIYKKRPDVKSVIHAHPPALVAFALARKNPDFSVISSVHELCGDCAYADYRLPGSSILGDVIAEEFEKGFNIVIMENHGVAVAGSSIKEAFLRLQAAEFCAQAILDASVLGSCFSTEAKNDNPDKEVALQSEIDDVFQKDASELAQCMKRAFRQKLLPYTYGSFSKRIKSGESDVFIINTEDSPRCDVSADDFVKVKGGSFHQKNNVSPSNDWKLHERIYSQHPEVDTIIITQSRAVMAHAVAHKKIDVLTNPESWVFVRDVGQLSSDASLDDVAKMISTECPAVLIDNKALVVTGGKLMQTFDRLEVCEFTALSNFLAGSVGSSVKIEKNHVQALRDAFC